MLACMAISAAFRSWGELTLGAFLWLGPAILLRLGQARDSRRTKALAPGGMDPKAFELTCKAKLEHMGYLVQHTGGGGDHCVDLVCRRDHFRMVVQCKRYRGTVGEPAVRDLLGAVVGTGADRGMLITTGGLSAAARAWARAKPLLLVDFSALGESQARL